LNGRVPTASLPLKWRFRFDPEERGRQERWFDARPGDWAEISTGEPWRLQPAAQKSKPARTVWYAVAFSRPAQNKLHLLFAGVGGQSRIWLNGRELAAQTAATFELKDLATRAGENRLAVRVETKNGQSGLFRPVWVLPN
jgi:beta-glucuronidase